MSIGINLNPDASCNFDCVYCCTDRRSNAPPCKIDLVTVESELRTLVSAWHSLFDEPEFVSTPPELRRLNDIAFSGDGEPTATPVFRDAVELVAGVRREHKLDDTNLVVITNACYLTHPRVTEALALLDTNNGEIWAKLDAGTDEHFRRVNRPRVALQHVLDNLLAASRMRPIVIQSLFCRIDGVPPPEKEIAAYRDRLRWLIDNGAQIRRVQVYTVARKTAESYVSPVSEGHLNEIAGGVRDLGLVAEVFA